MNSIFVEELRPQKFNFGKQSGNEQTDATNSITATELTFVTYNVWFGKYYFKERCEALLKIVRDCDADVIGLQEVTPNFLKIVLKQEWVRDRYYISDATGVTVQGYGVLLLSRIPIRRMFLHNLPTLMSRKLLVAELCVNEQTFNVATVHLESMKQSAPLRAEQLAEIFPLLSNSEHSVLMGDFNFCSSWTSENTNIDSSYQDLWAVLRSGEPGYTEDTDINLMRLHLTGKEKQVRFDRILLRSFSSLWQPQSIKRLGIEPISQKYRYRKVFPSDHFGLVGSIVWQPNIENC
jgi:tyrosyl-DNA phosphodiesterase 2